MHGDVRNSLRRMLVQAETVPARTEWTGRVQELVQNWKESVRDLANSEVEPMRPERLCKELTDCLPSDVILVSDTGHAGIWTGTMIDLEHPDQSYIRCAGSLGWALPAAMGAKCAQPDRPVLCFTGDGGIWYHLSELDTALNNGINTVTVVNNNHSLNQEKHGMERVYGGQSPGSDQLWLFPDTHFADVAESMGCFGITVNKPSELSGALDQAFAAGQTGGGRCQNPYRRHCAASVVAGVKNECRKEATGHETVYYLSRNRNQHFLAYSHRPCQFRRDVSGARRGARR